VLNRCGARSSVGQIGGTSRASGGNESIRSPLVSRPYSRNSRTARRPRTPTVARPFQNSHGPNFRRSEFFSVKRAGMFPVPEVVCEFTPRQALTGAEGPREPRAIASEARVPAGGLLLDRPALTQGRPCSGFAIKAAPGGPSSRLASQQTSVSHRDWCAATSE
jgi:hypothetical protein